MFFDEKATTQPILEEDHKVTKVQVIMVNYTPNSRNKPHTHVTETNLIITQGREIVAKKDEEHIVTPSMIVYVTHNEEHWYGATNDSSFTLYRYYGNLISSKSSSKK